MRNKTLKKILATAAVITSLLLSVGTAHAAGELDLSACLDAGGGTSWMSCPMIDTVQKTVNGIFVTVLQGWLEIKPELFKHLASDAPGSSVFSAWQYFQGIANIVLVIYLFVIILSQFTGIGISNYGIKKALPRVLLCALFVNLSYIMCQILVDVSNIAGGGIRAIFDKMIEGSALVARGEQDTGITIAIVAVVVGLLGVVIVLMKLSPVFIVPVMIAAIGLLLAVVFLFLVLGVRQVLAVLMVVVSPVAIICYSVPGLKGVYRKWFDTFKAVLLAYPIAAFMMGGGSLAAQILYQVWDGDNSFFGSLGAMLICIVPYFFIPNVIKGSIGQLARFTEGAKRSLHGFAGRRVANSDMAKDLKYKTDQKRAYRWAGIKTDGKGNIKRYKNTKRNQRLGRVGQIRRSRSGDDRYVDTALKFASDERELQNVQNNPTLMRDREDRMLEQEAANRISLRNEMPEALGERLSKAQDALSAASSSNNAQEMRLQEAEIRALTRSLSGTSKGRRVLRENLTESVFGGSRPPLSDNVKRVMGNSLSIDTLDDISKKDPRLAKALRRWGDSPTGALPDFSSPELQTYTEDMISNFSDQDFASLDGDIMAEMLGQSVRITPAPTGTAGAQSLEDAVRDGNIQLRNDAFSRAFAAHCKRTAGNEDLMGKASARKAGMIRGVANKMP